MSITATVNGEQVRWKDAKRYLWLLGLVVPLLPFGAARWVEQSGLSVFWWSGPIWILVMIPLLDWVFGTDRSNPPDWAVEPLSPGPLLPVVHLPVPAAAVRRAGVRVLDRHHP